MDDLEMRCAVCHGIRFVTEMTDGVTRHRVCDSCRPLVTMMFQIHQTLGTAVREAAQATRGEVLP